MNFSPKVDLEVVLCLNVELWSCDMSRDQKLKMKEIGKLATHCYFVWIKKLPFLIEGKHALLSTGAGMYVREVYIN